MTVADEASIRALVATLRRSEDRRTVLAIRAEPRWAGPEVLDGSPRCRVVAAPSPLAAREAVVRHGHSDDELLVLLTTCPAIDLGLDLQAQLVKGAVQSFDPFASVLALFKARVLDPVLASQRWLIDELIALAPADGWRLDSPVNGVLTEDMAWDAWQRARTGLAVAPQTLTEMLRLESDTSARHALAGLEVETRAAIALRWAPEAPTAAPVIAELLAGMPGPPPVALGLVVGLLWTPTEDADLAQRQMLARARLESVIGRDRLQPGDAARWAASAAEVIGPANDAGYLADAERTLAEVDAGQLAVLSDVLPRGFDARIDVLGRALSAADVASAEAALGLIERHRLSARRARRVQTCAAAVRLLRRTRRASTAPPSSVPEHAIAYRADGAWLEQARRDAAAGEQAGPIADALAPVLEAADTLQASTTKEFANALAEWSRSVPADDIRIIPVERILSDVVAPVAKTAPVLMVVCDGMGLAVSHQLLSDLRVEGWAPARPVDQGPWPVGVAALPTVTSCSRTSLLSGVLQDGAQQQERDGFASQPALRAASTTARPPLLFHKAGLVAANGLSLPDEIRAAVADPEQRVVGVVVNSVDDHLARGDQINVGWDLASLGPLAWLLDAAAEAGRLAILTADHGHVLDRGRSIAKPQQTDGGERWRRANTPPAEGEMAFSGPRVVLGGGDVVLPNDERIRYGPPKHGYHGGATPEEVLVPVEVLARRLPDGWTFDPLTPPDWWTGQNDSDDAPTTTPAAPTKRRSQADPDRAPTLFDITPPAEAPSRPTAGQTASTWVETLLASPTFTAHRDAVRLPRPLPDERLRRYLDAIAANADTISLPALSAATGEPAGTVRMTLSVVQRLLNLDGADVLGVRDDLVACNVELLALQFDLDLGARK